MTGPIGRKRRELRAGFSWDKKGKSFHFKRRAKNDSKGFFPPSEECFGSHEFYYAAVWHMLSAKSLRIINFSNCDAPGSQDFGPDLFQNQPTPAVTETSHRIKKN